MEIFSLSNLYGFTNLELSLSKYLRSNINVYNVCHMFVVARLYQSTELVTEVLNFIDNHALQVLQSEGFLSLLPVRWYWKMIIMFWNILRWNLGIEVSRDQKKKKKIQHIETSSYRGNLKHKHNDQDWKKKLDLETLR